LIYLQQAIQQPDSAEFIETMAKEIETNQWKKHWEILPMDSVKKSTKILQASTGSGKMHMRAAGV